ncbi:uncharacterized protein LOC116221582 [Clupea harengus]|uniref:Uncharacterized protein LOC116221582 n=1 Tax=Clupea harengus TaxID=7950 RepID=A0A6P8FQJ9_CLUHA|nr:uncharacterized protein LOC116221582 [Clupea harengus]
MLFLKALRLITTWVCSPVWIAYLHLCVNHVLAEKYIRVKCNEGDRVHLRSTRNITVMPGDDVRWTVNTLLVKKGIVQSSNGKHTVSDEGGLIICWYHKSDSGLYKVEIFNSYGGRKINQSFNLTINDSFQKVTEHCNRIDTTENPPCDFRRGHFSTIAALSFFLTTTLVMFVMAMRKTPLTKQEDTAGNVYQTMHGSLPKTSPDAASNVYQTMHGNSPKTSPDAASNVYQDMHGSLPRKTPTPDRTALDQNSSLYAIPKRNSTKRDAASNVYQTMHGNSPKTSPDAASNVYQTMHGNSPKTSPDAASNVYQTMHGSLPRKTPTPDRTALDQNSSLYAIPKRNSTKRHTAEFEDVYV